MEIIWPQRYSKENTRVHISSELEFAAPQEAVWSWLVRAPSWPEWYSPVTAVRVEGDLKELAQGTRFTWRIFGVTFSSRVEEFLPFERLAWSAQFEGVDAYHAWLIEKKEGGCRVLSEENQNGWLARINSLLRPSNARYYHFLWLQALAKKAAEGAPSG